MAASLTLRRWSIRRHNDEDVFTLAFGGDPVAFSEVYRRYQKPIYGYCLARLMEPEAAADATQEVFTRFLNAPRDDIEHPRAWLYTVAHNVTIDAIRKRARAPLPTDDEALDAAVSTSKTDAAEVFQGREDAHNVFIALRRLRPRYRTALILREFHHQSTADMADALDTTPGAVDTLVSRARDAFGRTYGEVAQLPDNCRDAVAAIYKRTGTGLDDAEEARLQAHLVVCDGCKTEMRRAKRLDGLSALLPFLFPAKNVGQNVFERAATTLQTSPELAAKLGYALPAHRVTPAVKIAAAALGITLIAAPIIGTVAHRQVEAPRPTPVTALKRSQNAHGQWGGRWSSDMQPSRSGWRGGWNSYMWWGPRSGSPMGMYGPSGSDKWSASGYSMGGWTPSRSKRTGSSMMSGSASTKSTWSSGSGRKRTSGTTSKTRKKSTWSSTSSGSSSTKRSGSHSSRSGSGSSSSGSMGSGGSMSGGW